MKNKQKTIFVLVITFILIVVFALYKYKTNLYQKNNLKNLKEETKEEKQTKEEAKEINIDYKKYNVNEMGNIPIMMYHKIMDIKKDMYNVDKNGYNRTKDGFINDLEFYYSNKYRMIKLVDYINGDINTELGFSPIVITFDDGNIDNIRVIGKNEDGSLIIDPNSAVGILEDFKKKYPDYNVTATFFLNNGLFGQKEYNYEILNWLINNGYDIGNHTYNHAYLDRINSNDVQKQIGSMYSKLNEIIPNKYVNIVALPYGIPYNKNHNNFKYIIEGEYNNFKYKTNGILRVGWDSNVSPHSKDFDPHSIKRARAYDNNGKDFDIKMVFNLLEKTRYVSDGNKDVVRVKDKNNIKDNINKKVVVYE